MGIDFTYITQPPKRWTFQQPKLKTWVESWCKGSVLNLFCGKVRLDIDELRVDIDPEMDSDVCSDAFEFVQLCLKYELKFDTVILDPPYNIRKAREKYGGRWIGKLTKIKNLLPEILNNEGRVVILGYDSVGMSKSRGFEKIALCVICHGGDHNDTIVIVERKKNKLT